jgi:hypothetical protein
MPRKQKDGSQSLIGEAKGKPLPPRPASAYLFYRALRAREASVRGRVFCLGSSDA